MQGALATRSLESSGRPLLLLGPLRHSPECLVKLRVHFQRQNSLSVVFEANYRSIAPHEGRLGVLRTREVNVPFRRLRIGGQLRGPSVAFPANANPSSDQVFHGDRTAGHTRFTERSPSVRTSNASRVNVRGAVCWSREVSKYGRRLMIQSHLYDSPAFCWRKLWHKGECPSADSGAPVGPTIASTRSCSKMALRMSLSAPCRWREPGAINVTARPPPSSGPCSFSIRRLANSHVESNFCGKPHGYHPAELCRFRTSDSSLVQLRPNGNCTQQRSRWYCKRVYDKRVALMNLRLDAAQKHHGGREYCHLKVQVLR